MRRDRFLIVTADDFGLHEAVNEAVIQASREGVLTSTSLMVGGPACADAVRRARELPQLRVGLHLALVDALPVLPVAEIPHLVDAAGRFRSRMALDGARYFLSPRARRELSAEIRAQFQAFAATGLALDHVNAHKHYHLHPTLLSLLLSIGAQFGMRAVRWPYEPPGAAAPWSVRAGNAALSPWLALMRHRLRRAGMLHNDRLYGIARSGSMNEPALLALIQALPAGVSEIYLHPGTQSGSTISPAMSGYRHRDELDALLSARVRSAVAPLARGGYSDWVRLHDARRAA